MEQQRLHISQGWHPFLQVFQVSGEFWHNVLLYLKGLRDPTKDQGAGNVGTDNTETGTDNTGKTKKEGAKNKKGNGGLKKKNK